MSNDLNLIRGIIDEIHREINKEIKNGKYHGRKH